MTQLQNTVRIGANDSGKVTLGTATTNQITALAGGGTNTVITAAENTNGIIVRTLVAVGKIGTNTRFVVYGDTIPLFGFGVQDNRECWNVEREFILPAGVALEIAASQNTCAARATWDDLP